MPESMTPLVAVGVIGALFILLLSLLTNNYSLNNIKSKTVGDGQYGTARWATETGKDTAKADRSGHCKQ